MANFWENDPVVETPAAAASGGGDQPWTNDPPVEDVAAGMALRGVPVLGAYVPQAEAALRAITGQGEGGSFAERYANLLPQRQQIYRQAEQNQPVASEALKLGGSMAALGPLGYTAAGGRLLGTAGGSLLSRIPLAAGSTAALSAADAAARGEDPLTAGGAGAVAGAAGPIIGRAAGLAAQGVRSILPGAPSASEALATRMARTAASADELLAPGAAAGRAAEVGPLATAAEYGPNMRGLAQAVASQPGAGRTTLADVLEQRAAGTRQRVEGEISGVLGPRQNMAELTLGETQARQIESSPLYKQWQSVKVHPTAEIKSLVPILESDGLLASARKFMALEGKPTNVDFFTTGARKDYPTPEAFDYVKQAIGDRIGAALKSGDRNVARIYTNLKDRLDTAIANANPDAAKVWKQARETWGNRTSILNARDAGQDLFKPSTRRDDLQALFQGYSGPEKSAFREGARDALAEMIDRSHRGDANVRNMLLAPTNQEKMLLIASDPKQVPTLTKSMQREMDFAQMRQDVLHGSQTAVRQAMGQVTQPQPGSTLVGQVRNLDISHPLRMIPQGLERMAETRQGARYEAARARLAEILSRQGPAAQATFGNLPMPGAGGAGLDRFISTLPYALAPRRR